MVPVVATRWRNSRQSSHNKELGFCPKSNVNPLFVVFALQTDGCLRIALFCHFTYSSPVECSSLKVYLNIPNGLVPSRGRGSPHPSCIDGSQRTQIGQRLEQQSPSCSSTRMFNTGRCVGMTVGLFRRTSRSFRLL
jgi:hypothetical protein